MSGSMIIKPAVGDFRPAVTNLVSKVSIPSSAPVIVKTAGGAIINPTADFKILDTTKNILSGVPKEKFDTVFETVKKTSKNRLKKSANWACGGVVAGKAGKKQFGKILSSTFRRMKLSGKMKAVAAIVALGVAAYLYFKD